MSIAPPHGSGPGQEGKSGRPSSSSMTFTTGPAWGQVEGALRRGERLLAGVHRQRRQPGEGEAGVELAALLDLARDELPEPNPVVVAGLHGQRLQARPQGRDVRRALDHLTQQPVLVVVGLHRQLYPPRELAQEPAEALDVRLDEPGAEGVLV